MLSRYAVLFKAGRFAPVVVHVVDGEDHRLDTSNSTSSQDIPVHLIYSASPLGQSSLRDEVLDIPVYPAFHLLQSLIKVPDCRYRFPVQVATCQNCQKTRLLLSELLVVLLNFLHILLQSVRRLKVVPG